MARLAEYEYALINDELDACVEELASIVRVARRRTAAQDDAVAFAARSFLD